MPMMPEAFDDSIDTGEILCCLIKLPPGWKRAAEADQTAVVDLENAPHGPEPPTTED